MPLSSLPTELLDQIFAYIKCIPTLHALTLTNRRFYPLADYLLYRQDARQSRLAISWAATHGKIELLKKSLSHGARVPPTRYFANVSVGEPRQFYGRTTRHSFPDPGPSSHLLCTAVENGHVEFVNLLLDLGCSVNMKNHHHLSVLCLAVIQGRADLVRTLLTRGARQDLPLYCIINSPIQIAAFQGNQEMVEVLLNYSDSSRPDEQQMQAALECAMLESHFHLIPLLPKFDFNLDFYIYDQPFRTPLIWAAREGHIEFVQLFLCHGANPSFPNGWEHPPILAAVANRHEEIVRLLTPLTHRIQVTRALTLSMSQADGRIAQILLEHGAKPDFEAGDAGELTGYHANECLLGMNDQLVPPLIAAVSQGHANLVRLLVDHGADVNAGYHSYFRPRDENVPDGFDGASLLLAMQLGYEEIAGFLRENGGREDAGKWEDPVEKLLTDEMKAQFMKWAWVHPRRG
ncbi:ankyrin repeat-containing domain protein [Aspergillus egyptiacus]|nr:ankyrin repeat-containing domain protein [Aspergillus egyptiacus]